MRPSKMMRLAVAVLASAVTLAACGGDSETGGSNGEELRKVDIGLSTGSLAVFMYYAAETLGYYEDEGLDVTITPTEGSSDSAAQLAAGNFDVAQGASSAMLALMGEVELHPFYSVITHEYRDWVVAADSDIQSVADLEGTTIGVSDLAGGEVPIVRFILSENGINPQTGAEIVALGEEPATVVGAFEKDRVDSYSTSRSALIPIEEAGITLRSIFPESFSAGPVEALVAGPEAAEDTELLVAVGRATAKGTAFCAADVEACLDVIEQDHPELVADRDTARAIVETFIELSMPPEQDGRPYYGPVDQEGWERYMEIFSSGEDPLIADPDAIDLDALVVDGLQEEINDFDLEEVEEQARSYESS